MIENAKIIIQAMLARKASSVPLGLNRIDYPEMDPPEWDKYLTLKLEKDRIQLESFRRRFWANMKEQYEAK